MPLSKKNLAVKPSIVKPVLILLVIISLALGGYALFSKKNNGPIKNEEINSIIANWIAENPQAIIDSVTNMQRKMMEEQTKAAQQNISTKKSELYEDKDSPSYSANKNYDVTIVEFFDYACGYCKKVNSSVEQLLNSDKKVRIIYKEFPILGGPSMEMSKAALAVNIINPELYKEFHDALMDTTKRGKEAVSEAAAKVGIAISKLEKVIEDNKSQIEDAINRNLQLGSSIGVRGTPGFVFGEELVPGAIGFEDMKEKVSQMRSM